MDGLEVGYTIRRRLRPLASSVAVSWSLSCFSDAFVFALRGAGVELAACGFCSEAAAGGGGRGGAAASAAGATSVAFPRICVSRRQLRGSRRSANIVVGEQEHKMVEQPDAEDRKRFGLVLSVGPQCHFRRVSSQY